MLITGRSNSWGTPEVRKLRGYLVTHELVTVQFQEGE